MRLPNVLLIALPAAAAIAGLSSSYMLPVDDDAIRYTKGALNDPVARLQSRLDRGEKRLKYEDDFGYLPSVLKELAVPVSSQLLVFSKTSFQASRIAPRTPRALYFNDSVTVGFVRTGEVLEFAALDPRQGVIFYTLDQERTSRPHFERRDVCLQCHQSGATFGVPGLMIRSVTPDRTGMPVMSAGGFITSHTSPLKDRWGGWYVSGHSGRQQHMGNAILENPEEGERLPVTEGHQNVTNLMHYFDTGAYLAPDSDIVALMTLEHQTQAVNLMTRVGWEARLGHPGLDSAVEELLEYMLFADEAPLTDPIKGTSSFASDFQALGPRDPQGRSLRDFDLRTRMFRYPLSFMIYSEEFDALPPAVRSRFVERLNDVLAGKDTSPKFAHLTSADRVAIREILRSTKRDLL
jgi:hypothetical protein